MQIFGKRKSKKASSENSKNGCSESAVSEADRAAEELLELDPSTLNAKERRMIKRYRERNPDKVGKEKETSLVEKENRAGTEGKETESSVPENEECVALEGNIKDDCEADDNEKKDSQDTLAPPSKDIQRQIEAASLVKEKADKQSCSMNEQEVRKLLEGLNSKQRRKLTRQLDREGSKALDEIYKEVVRFMGEKKVTEESKPKLVKSLETASGKSDVGGFDGTKKKKKKQQDWNLLPPEERLRREEQRRLQKEAAERRAKGGQNSTKHKHPLNSERRRANRRKPRWTRKRPAEYVNDHNTSGFHMRKLQKRETH